jgi:hypothetical protein
MKDELENNQKIQKRNRRKSLSFINFLPKGNNNEVKKCKHDKKNLCLNNTDTSHLPTNITTLNSSCSNNNFSIDDSNDIQSSLSSTLIPIKKEESSLINHINESMSIEDKNSIINSTMTKNNFEAKEEKKQRRRRRSSDDCYIGNNRKRNSDSSGDNQQSSSPYYKRINLIFDTPIKSINSSNSEVVKEFLDSPTNRNSFKKFRDGVINLLKDEYREDTIHQLQFCFVCDGENCDNEELSLTTEYTGSRHMPYYGSIISFPVYRQIIVGNKCLKEIQERNEKNDDSSRVVTIQSKVITCYKTTS